MRKEKQDKEKRRNIIKVNGNDYELKPNDVVQHVYDVKTDTVTYKVINNHKKINTTYNAWKSEYDRRVKEMFAREVQDDLEEDETYG